MMIVIRMMRCANLERGRGVAHDRTKKKKKSKRVRILRTTSIKAKKRHDQPPSPISWVKKSSMIVAEAAKEARRKTTTTVEDGQTDDRGQREKDGTKGGCSSRTAQSFGGWRVKVFQSGP